jgi:peptidoglycan/LPS O-acetylase OafA/YrhL
LWDWLWDFIYSSNPFADARGYWYPEVFRTHYLDQMWTIPVEFRGSLALFWFLAAAAFLSTRGRRIFACVVVGFSYWWGAIYVGLFLFGMLIADCSFDRHPERLRPRVQLAETESIGAAAPSSTLAPVADEPAPTPSPSRQSIAARLGFVCLALFGMFLMGQPEDEKFDGAPWPWPVLGQVVPPWYPASLGEHFWLSFGAAIFVWAVDSCRVLQLPFEWGFSQYLGDLSFGLYAMHNTINWALYEKFVEPWSIRSFGQDSYWSGALGIIFTTLVMLWAADYFTRIDDRVVWAGKWLESRTFIKSGS